MSYQFTSNRLPLVSATLISGILSWYTWRHRQAETLQDEADIVLLKPVSPAQLRELALRLRSMGNT